MGTAGAPRHQRGVEARGGEIPDARQPHGSDDHAGSKAMTRRDLLAIPAAAAFAAEHLNRAPISNGNLTVKLPQAGPVRLPNGITVLAVEDNRLPIALVRFQVEGAGAIYSPRPGVAELTAEMLREG